MSNAIQGQSTGSAEWDRRTGCLLWRGPISAKHGRPIIYAQGHPVLVSRANWSGMFGQPPKGAQLKSVCATASCVSPYHWAIRSPAPFMRRLGLSSGLLSKLVRLLMAMTESGEIRRVTWEGPLAGLECDPQELAKLTNEVPGLPMAAALAAYAQLLWRADRGRPTASGEEALLKLEARASLRLLERGAAVPSDAAIPEGERE